MTAQPPEFRLLLALLRQALGTAGPAAYTPPEGAIDWPKFNAGVDRHRVGAFLHHRLPAAVKASLDPGALRRLENHAQKTTRRALERAGETTRLAGRLEGAGIPCASLKGPLLARRLYGDFGQRHAGDLDLLIRPEDALRADALVQASGYRRTWPPFTLTAHQAGHFVRIKPDFEYEHDKTNGLRVELLWRLECLPPFDPSAKNRRKQPLAGREIVTLPESIEIPYLFLHGARHGWFRLFWLVDVALLLRDPAVDWPAILATARTLRLERPLLQGAALAGDLLGVSLPDALQASPAERPYVRRLSAEAIRQMLLPETAQASTREWFRALCYRLRLHSSWRARWNVVRPHAFSPLGWQTLSLPDRWFFLYPVLTPFLWLWRRLTDR